MKSTTSLILGLLCAGFLWNGPLCAADSYPAPAPWQPSPEQREHLRRSLTLLNSSTPTDRKTVRVLFYGQSITQQAWTKEVERYLRSTYTNANLIIENRAIGGHASQLLVKTAEADLYPFQPDLLIFHVYGSHIEYENIIRRVRERTCADILLQTDHITSDASLTEETDPAKLTPAKWDPWMNHVFLPSTATKYGACRADIHELWKTYLNDQHLKASDLLKDGVHLNAQGEWLMADLLKAYLAPLPLKAGYDPMNDSRVRTIAVSLPVTGNALRLEFTGTRADLIFKEQAKKNIAVMVDGKSPSTIPDLYTFTRVSAFPASDWPVLLRVSSKAPLVAEEWSLKIDQASADGKVCHFSLRGSVTCEDGEGVSTNRFVSKSGRVVIEPDDWNVAYSVTVFKRALPENHIATWKSILRGSDTAASPAASPGTESCVTVAEGLLPGHHVLELCGAELAGKIQEVRFYNPQGNSSQTADRSSQDHILFNGSNLEGWRQPHGDWRIAKNVSLNAAAPEVFVMAPGTGVMVNGDTGRTVDLMTEKEFGDFELHVEFCVASHSNSGVYLQGRYEVQIYDSFGVGKDAYPGIECGGIYPRWINDQGIDGHSPKVNASKPAGEWQFFDIQFQAPRFDADGKKTANARIVRVTHNGQVIHENVELNGPTRSAHFADEKAFGPILLQGDHGPVAYRNLQIRGIDSKTGKIAETL